MANSRRVTYKGSVTWISAINGAVSAINRPAWALLLVSALGCALSCADSDSTRPDGSAGGMSSAGQSGAPTVGEGGAASAGESGIPGHAAGEGGTGNTGATNTGGNAGAPPIRPEHCEANSDCDDGLFCNGVELCLTLPGEEFKVCMGREHGPCAKNYCNEIDKCDCNHSDEDGDNAKVEGCAMPGDSIDCDDNDRTRAPGKPEECGNDKLHDEDCDDTTFGNKDTDGDQVVDQDCANELDYQPLFFRPSKPLTSHGTDCDDRDRLTNPDAEEICDRRDNNCNGQIDEVAEGKGTVYYEDLDDDHWGNDEKTQRSLCGFPPPGYAIQGHDCNDQDRWVHPDQQETCNGVDDDCDLDGKIDQPDKPGNLMSGEPYDGGKTKFECVGVDGWKVKQCPSDLLDCNGKYLDACETIGTTLCNCHGCGTTCAFSCGDTTCEEIVRLSTGNRHTCAIVQAAGSSSGGTIACWGRNNFGQLGNESTSDSLRARKVLGMTGVTAIAAGERHTCAIGADEIISCWGDNKYGQLGAAVTDLIVRHPAKVSPSPFLRRAKSIGSGSFHTCAIFDEGKLACWGLGDLGQLGNNDTENVDFPLPVQRIVDGKATYIANASQVVAGYIHTCSLSAGRVECWGDNSNQQLGVDPSSLEFASSAIPVAGFDGQEVLELSASAYHTCARAGGDVYCWGSNIDHELALESGDSASPVKIRLPVAATAIATGSYFGCALGDTGKVYCWGSNDAGELGPAYNPTSVLPVAIPLVGVTGIFAGLGGHVCAILRDAITLGTETWCWGNNDFGELGNGRDSDLPQPTPSRVLPLNGSQACASQN